MTEEARLEETPAGLTPVSEGWFVVNVADTAWVTHHAFGAGCVFENRQGLEFPELGINISVIEPGQPLCLYHREGAQENFLMLAGEGVLLVNGEERPLRTWDFVHSPAGTEHVIVGAGDGPCVLLCASSRQFQKDGPWGFYCVDETAARHNAASPEDTQDGTVAYARFPPSRATRYPDGLLPERASSTT